MAQWTNSNRNNRSVNTWMSEISGALHLALPGFMVGRQVAGTGGRQNTSHISKF